MLFSREAVSVAAEHLFVNSNFIYKLHLFSQGCLVHADHTASFSSPSSEGCSRPLSGISELKRAIKNSSVKWKNYLPPAPSTCPRTYSMGDGLSLIYGILAKEMRIGHAKQSEDHPLVRRNVETSQDAAYRARQYFAGLSVPPALIFCSSLLSEITHR